MEKKKMTNAQLERKLKNAVLHIDRTKETQGIFFDDKLLRITVNEDYAIIATGFHQHVFNAITPNGASRPFLYTKRFIEIALENDCTVRDAKGNITRSYAKLMNVLKEKEDKSDYNICWYIDLWLNNIFAPLYSIGESESEAFLVYESYLHNIARNHVILSEKVNDITNKGFIKEVNELVDKFTEGMEEKIIFPKKTDEEKASEEINALSEQQQEKAMEEQANGNHE